LSIESPYGRTREHPPYGNIVSVDTATEENTKFITPHGVEELRDMLTSARRSSEDWRNFFEASLTIPTSSRASRKMDCGSNRAVTNRSSFDAKRYWRGPVWLVVNYMIADGLTRVGQGDAAARITASSLDLIRESGFAEYYDPITGEPLGGGRFTWTAAMVLEFLAMEG
jgi:hypothetical protein